MPETAPETAPGTAPGTAGQPEAPARGPWPNQEGLVCDLCDRPVPIAWTYETPNEASSAEEALRTGRFWAQDPEWAVCEDCHGIVSGGTLDQLVAFSVLAQIAAMALRGRTPVPGHVEEVRRVHSLFWRHRRPDPRPEPGYRVVPRKEEA